MKKATLRLILIIAVGTITVLFGGTMFVLSLLHPVVLFAAIDDVATTAEDTPTTVSILQNDKDEDVATLTIKEYSQPAHGYVVKYGTGLRYTPYTNYNGTDSFTYTIQNSAGETATATVTLTITAANDAPKAYNDLAATTSGTEVVIDVKANDTDADGDGIVVEGYTRPGHGTVSITADNKILYVPDAGYVGTDDFAYDISDGNGGTDRGTVNVTVRAAE